MAKRFFYSEENYDDFMFKSGGTGHGEDKNGIYEVDYEPKFKENEN